MGQDLKIALFQSDIVWESAAETCGKDSSLVDSFYAGLQKAECPDLLVFPEFFSTGFSMNPEIAEDENGVSVSWMRMISRKYSVAVCATVPTKSGDKIYNRCHFITPDGKEYHYDKRHLFRMSDEPSIFSTGNEKVIVNYLDWKIALNICYDLRFPVWSRNVGLGYDLMINMASWADSRIKVPDVLVKARAIENLSYYAFVNRCGLVGDELYSGHSRVVNPKGDDIAVEQSIEGVKVFTATLSKSAMERFRDKFPAWMDAD